MNRYLKTLLILLLFVTLALVRLFEAELFYDPLLNFFKTEYITAEPPTFDLEKLLLHSSLRYWLNSFLSILIIFCAFSDKNVVKFAILFYFLMFLILITSFFILLKDLGQENYMILFYVRRFLIQPILVLLLLPAFYYQKLKNSADF